MGLLKKNTKRRGSARGEHSTGQNVDRKPPEGNAKGLKSNEGRIVSMGWNGGKVKPTASEQWGITEGKAEGTEEWWERVP